MTPAEAGDVIAMAKWVMVDMGMSVEAGKVEQAEHILYCSPSAVVAHQLADSILPRGKRGRQRLVLRRPQEARALSYVAAVLRAVEN